MKTKIRPALKPALLAAAILLSRAAAADVTSVNLGDYVLSATYALPGGTASEASAVTYNWDTDTLFVLGDEGDELVEVSKTGQQLSVMHLQNFDDTEGLTYLGGGQFAVVEERLRDLYKLTYTADATVARGSLPSADIGPATGNTGTEGVSFDPRNGTFVTVKEKGPQAVERWTVVFGGGAGTSSSVSVFDDPEGKLHVADLSDVQLLSAVPSLQGTADADNMLIYSQESGLLMEVSPDGSILSTFSLAALSGSAEGVTIDRDGNIYVVDESPQMFVLKAPPVPLPAAGWLLSSGVVGLLGFVRRRRARAA